jgi:HSP20 family protein
MLRSWDMTHEVQRLWEDVDRLFGQVLGATPERSRSERIVVRPALSVEETDHAYHLMLDVPGVPRDGLDVELDGRTLHVRAVRDERRAYERWITLPDGVDADSISADLRDGVLRLTLPKLEQARRRTIAIGSAPEREIDAIASGARDEAAPEPVGAPA